MEQFGWPQVEHFGWPPGVKDGKRELVIGRATRGYVALYRYVAAIDTVFLLAVQAQREAGYKRGDGL